MSQMLLVRRQKFVREIRRNQVKQYMKTIRDKLLSSSLQPSHEEQLTEAAIQAFKSELQRGQYCEQALCSFLKSLSKYSGESLCNPYFMAIFEVGLMHYFQKQQQPNNIIKYLAQDVLMRMIACKPNANGSIPIEKCFKEVLQILACPVVDLFEIWKGISMLRCPIFLQHSFNQLRFVLSRFNEAELLEKMSSILEIFGGFTSSIQGCQKTSISISSVAEIINSLEKLLDCFTFSGEDIIRVAAIMQNILKMHCFDAITTLLQASSIYRKMLEYLTSEEAESIGEEAICRILQVFYVSFGGASSITEKIMSNTGDLLKVLTSYLPAIPVLQSKYGQWPPFSKKVLLKVMVCFCNLACCENFSFPAIKYSIIDWSIAYSKHPDSEIKNQVGIFLFNIVAVSSDEQLEILLEKNMLQAVANLIRDDWDGEVSYYGLKTLKTILQASQNFPDNNKAWCFNPATVAFHCRRLNIPSSLQRLFMGPHSQNSALANKCLDLLPEQ